MRVIRLARFAAAVAIGFLVLGEMANSATAQEQSRNKAVSPGDTAGASKKPAGKGDAAVNSAFALPKGAVLNTRQKDAYDQLKAAKEQEFRDALDEVQKSHGGAATTAAVKKVRELRAEIHKSIDDIVGGAGPGPSKGKEGQQSYSSGSDASGAYTAQYGNYGSTNNYGPNYYPGYYPGYYPNGRYPDSRYPYPPKSSDGKGKYYSGGPSGTSGSNMPAKGKYPPGDSSTRRPPSGSSMRPPSGSATGKH